MGAEYGPRFRWFAWHPVHTADRGWRWLRFVWRRRMSVEVGAHWVFGWSHSVGKTGDIDA